MEMFLLKRPWMKSSVLHVGIACFLFSVAWWLQGFQQEEAVSIELSIVSKDIHLEAEHGKKRVLPVRKANPESKPTGEQVSTSEVSSDVAASALPIDPIQDYVSRVISLINEDKQYPRIALQNHEEGVVEILVEVDRDGKIINVILEKPSRHASLNRAALDLVRQMGSLPPLPLGIESSIRLHIPVEYRFK